MNRAHFNSSKEKYLQYNLKPSCNPVTSNININWTIAGLYLKQKLKSFKGALTWLGLWFTVLRPRCGINKVIYQVDHQHGHGVRSKFAFPNTFLFNIKLCFSNFLTLRYADFHSQNFPASMAVTPDFSHLFYFIVLFFF